MKKPVKVAKHINVQNRYDIPEGYTHIALNRLGMLCAFHNPPVRDYRTCEWVDSTDGSSGDILPYEKWDISLKTIEDCTDMRGKGPGEIKHREAGLNAIAYKQRLKEKKCRLNSGA